MPFIDNLNTLYVAFTRSKDELIVFSPRPKKMKDATGEVEKISTLTDALWLVCARICLIHGRVRS